MTKLFLFLSLFSIFSAFSQENRKLIQLSGVVVDSKSLDQVPFTSIMIKNSNRGTISDYSGYYSFVAQELDTVIFSYIGYGTASYVIPDTLTKSRYSLIQMLSQDTIALPETEIYPWPSIAQFNEAFANLYVSSEDYDHAMRNLALNEMKERVNYAPIGFDGSFNAQMQVHQSRLYHAGAGSTAGNILNPVAWARFISDWKSGKLKKKR